MEPRKLTSADIDKVRDIEGFPIATDDAIIELSNAPYYTACPNPFIEDFIAENGTMYDEDGDEYRREPFSSDVSEGKNDCFYSAHSYHTKVPHKAIMRYILHYTNPGDIVLDGFCGTGMTGVAAQMCSNPDPEFKLLVEQGEEVRWGARYAILSDLSPIATFITANYNQPSTAEEFRNAASELLAKCQEECGWMYETIHSIDNSQPTQMSLADDNRRMGTINYTVWTDVVICPNCGTEMSFWDVAVDEEHRKVRDKFHCPDCGMELSKRDCEKATETFYDESLGRTVSLAKQAPVFINYTYGGKRFEKKLDAYDYERLERIKQYKPPYWYPTAELPDGFNTRQPKISHGVECVHQFLTKANLLTLSTVAHYATSKELRCLISDILPRGSRMHKIAVSRLNTNLSKTAGILSGTLYIPSNTIEYSILSMLQSRITDVGRFLNAMVNTETTIISTQSTTDLSQIPDSSVDYIFTDPPFGENLNYSELNFLTESWLNVFTNNGHEAIINSVQGKNIVDYQGLMTQCFEEYCRVLKPGRWMTVEFHNSKNAVWNAIQESLQRAGFIVADVRTLHKGQGSFKQVTTTSAVKQDLVISAYKPRVEFVRDVLALAGNEQTAWAFVQQYLANLPIVVVKHNEIEIIAERQAYLLFDRMVSFHIMQGLPIPIDASDFYKGLDERYAKRDEMYFLPNQVTEYDTARMKLKVEEIQFALLVTNEKTAIGWLYHLLANNPQTYAEIQPTFMQEVKKVDRYEDMPELAVLLEENFLQDDKGRWYVPDTKKEGDITKLREKSLLREFDGYLKSKGKLKLFRSEAIRVGFSHLWKDKNYQAIVDLANRLPAATIQEDPNLLMYYDISLSRVG